jgi:hypothetical protein
MYACTPRHHHELHHDVVYQRHTSRRGRDGPTLLPPVLFTEWIAEARRREWIGRHKVHIYHSFSSLPYYIELFVSSIFKCFDTSTVQQTRSPSLERMKLSIVFPCC